MNLFISVIICTHNPRLDYLNKVLAALKSQTFSLEQWELLLIDNASERLLFAEIDLSWHPRARYIREEQIGLTPARLRGIQEAHGQILVFVDDDNVLDSDYLEVTLRISKNFSFLGAWGGQIRPNFEVPPPEWTKLYWGYLAIREFEQDKWSNLLHQHETTPCGAGLCVRKIVAEQYADTVSKNPKRLGLDRQGKLLLSGGDTDLAFTACDIGLGTGQFTDLKLTHLIPAHRLEEEYLVRLVEGMTYSQIILPSFRGQMPCLLNLSWKKKIYEYCKFLLMSSRDRKFYFAEKRARALAIKEILEASHFEKYTKKAVL